MAKNTHYNNIFTKANVLTIVWIFASVIAVIFIWYHYEKEYQALEEIIEFQKITTTKN